MSENKEAQDNLAEEVAQAPAPQQEEEINYNDFQLDPSKEVLVPISTYIALTNLVAEVEKKHSKVVRTDKYAHFNRQTHQKLSAKNKAKMKPEKLQKEYYENIDFEATNKNHRIDRDELGSAAIRLLGEFRGIFELNVQRGNRVIRPEVAAKMQAEAEKSGEAKDSQEGPVVAGPTLVENES